jgi:hypothetical protein
MSDPAGENWSGPNVVYPTGVRLPWGQSRLKARWWFLGLPQYAHRGIIWKALSLTLSHPGRDPRAKRSQPLVLRGTPPRHPSLRRAPETTPGHLPWTRCQPLHGLPKLLVEGDALGCSSCSRYPQTFCGLYLQKRIADLGISGRSPLQLERRAARHQAAQRVLVSRFELCSRRCWWQSRPGQGASAPSECSGRAVLRKDPLEANPGLEGPRCRDSRADFASRRWSAAQSPGRHRLALRFQANAPRGTHPERRLQAIRTR